MNPTSLRKSLKLCCPDLKEIVNGGEVDECNSVSLQNVQSKQQDCERANLGHCEISRFRIVEQRVVPRISSRERNGGSGPDHSPETELLMYQWRYNPNTNNPYNSKTIEVLQIQFLDRVVDRWRPQVRPAREVCR